jgi:hypothetical protein
VLKHPDDPPGMIFAPAELRVALREMLAGTIADLENEFGDDVVSVRVNLTTLGGKTMAVAIASFLQPGEPSP